MAKTDTILITGLGNPGPEYEKTRHNVGFAALDLMRAHFNFPKFSLTQKFQAEVSMGNLGGRKIILAKPQTFMNNSGRAVQAITAYYKIAPDNIWVIHDDLDLPLGSVKTRENGSSGGHNGVDSIIQNLGSSDFWRFKIGISSPRDSRFQKNALVKDQTIAFDSKKFVLSRFKFGEKAKINKATEEIVKRIEDKLGK